MFDFFSTILLNVLHNFSLTVLLPWQHTGLQTSPTSKAFRPPLAFYFHICKWCLIYMIKQAYKYVSLSLWPCLAFFRAERVCCHGNKMFYSRRCVFCRTISLPIFNGLRCKLAKITLFIYVLQCWVEGMTSSVITFAYFTHFSNLNIS